MHEDLTRFPKTYYGKNSKVSQQTKPLVPEQDQLEDGLRNTVTNRGRSTKKDAQHNQGYILEVSSKTSSSRINQKVLRVMAFDRGTAAGEAGGWHKTHLL